jgi:hypothetical protein
MFTPAEANAELPRVRPLVERLVALRAELLAARALLAELAVRIGGNGGGIPPERPRTLAREAATAEAGIRETLQELGAVGVLVKDLDGGIVDFPSLREGVPVLLCWQLGEEAVGFWHGLEEGFAGRRPL